MSPGCTLYYLLPQSSVIRQGKKKVTSDGDLGERGRVHHVDVARVGKALRRLVCEKDGAGFGLHVVGHGIALHDRRETCLPFAPGVASLVLAVGACLVAALGI